MAENMDDRALEEQMRGLLDDGRDMAEFGASDAACYLYPEADQGPLREAFCRGAGYDHVRVVTLIRQLEAAKGALKAAGPHVCSALCASVKQTGSDWTHSPLCNEIVATLSTPAEKPEELSPADERVMHDALLATMKNKRRLAPAEKPEAVETGDDLTKPFEPAYIIDRENGLTQYVHEDVAYVAQAIGAPNVCDALLALDDRRLIGVQFWFTPPEAVETGEPVAWPFGALSKGDAYQGDGADYATAGINIGEHYDRIQCYGRPIAEAERLRDAVFNALAASPVPDGEARRKALEEAAEIADDMNRWQAQEARVGDPVSAGKVCSDIARAIRALAAIPTAGDAK